MRRFLMIPLLSLLAVMPAAARPRGWWGPRVVVGPVCAPRPVVYGGVYGRPWARPWRGCYAEPCYAPAPAPVAVEGWGPPRPWRRPRIVVGFDACVR